MNWIIFATLVCGKPQIKNTSGHKLNEFDYKTLERATKVCYNKYNSCVKLFWKYDKIDYKIICGDNND